MAFCENAELEVAAPPHSPHSTLAAQNVTVRIMMPPLRVLRVATSSQHTAVTAQSLRPPRIGLGASSACM